MFIYIDYFKESYMRNFDIPIWECPKSELCLHVTYYGMRMTQIGMIYVCVYKCIYAYIH